MDTPTRRPPLLPAAERLEIGKNLRRRAPRSAHAEWRPARQRRDPVELLDEAHRGWPRDLLAVRYGRMQRTPFAFFRGALAIMAADLAETPSTGIRVQACGDAHLLNFGGAGTAARDVVFDLHDFDETLPAPWEWDLKRLAASIVLGGRQVGVSDRLCREAVREAARAYREHVAEYAAMPALRAWFSRIDGKSLVDLVQAKEAHERRLAEAGRGRSLAFEHLFPSIVSTRGGPRFGQQPPFIVPLRRQPGPEREVRAVLRHYREQLPEDRRVLLDRFALRDVALKATGVSGVGLRCAVVLLTDVGEATVTLQVKEARPSLLEPYAGRAAFPAPAERVVNGQRLLQSSTDLFLGAAHGREGSFYVRQLKELMVAPRLDHFTAASLGEYTALCGWALARAHSRGGDAARIAGYLGHSDSFDRALDGFAVAYADQVERDHAGLRGAIRTGRLRASIERGA